MARTPAMPPSLLCGPATELRVAVEGASASQKIPSAGSYRKPDAASAMLHDDVRLSSSFRRLQGTCGHVCASALSALNVKRLRIRSIESQRTRGRCPAILASEKCFRKADARSATGKDSGGDGNREIYLSVPSATLSDSQGEEDDTFLESISSPLPKPLFGHDLHGDTR